MRPLFHQSRTITLPIQVHQHKMAPIPIYTQSPINAAKASGVTPQTAADANSSPDARQPTVTATPSRTEQGYPAAQPGARPSLPAPTGAAHAGRYAPEQPTPTAKPELRGPPPPQPGAVPVAPGARSAVPPPPRATEGPRLPDSPIASRPSALPTPPQMAIPTPTMPFSQRGTSTDGASAPSYYGQFGQQQQNQPAHFNSLANPPGYQQNANASTFSSDQRAAHNALRFSDRGNASMDGEEEGAWDSAKKWAQAAGGKLSAAESEVWRRINKGE